MSFFEVFSIIVLWVIMTNTTRDKFKTFGTLFVSITFIMFAWENFFFFYFFCIIFWFLNIFLRILRILNSFGILESFGIWLKFWFIWILFMVGTFRFPRFILIVNGMHLWFIFYLLGIFFYLLRIFLNILFIWLSLSLNDFRRFGRQRNILRNVFVLRNRFFLLIVTHSPTKKIIYYFY